VCSDGGAGLRRQVHERHNRKVARLSYAAERSRDGCRVWTELATRANRERHIGQPGRYRHAGRHCGNESATTDPPIVLDGFNASEVRTGGSTVIVAVCVTPLKTAHTVAVVAVATALVVTLNVALVAPSGTVAGTLTDASLLDKAITAPPVGASALSESAPVDELPPFTRLSWQPRLQICTFIFNNFRTLLLQGVKGCIGTFLCALAAQVAFFPGAPNNALVAQTVAPPGRPRRGELPFPVSRFQFWA
jgi:hypothetical protein